MDDKTWLGSIGESKVVSELSRYRFHVFTQVTGKAPFDLVAYKDSYLYKINVKTTQTLGKWGAWEVQIKSVRSNRTKNRTIPFDSNSCDVLAVYIEPLDKVCFLSSSEVSGRSAIALREKTVHKSKFPPISELTNPERIQSVVDQKDKTNKGKTDNHNHLSCSSLSLSSHLDPMTLENNDLVSTQNKNICRPSKEELEKMIWETSVLEVSRGLGVSNVAVAKWCKKYGIPRPPRGYWAKKNQAKTSKL